MPTKPIRPGESPLNPAHLLDCPLIQGIRARAFVIVPKSVAFTLQTATGFSWRVNRQVITSPISTRTGIDNGRPIRSVGKGGRPGECLDSSQVPRIVKEMARQAGLLTELAVSRSGHSTRVGAAHDVIAANIELPLSGTGRLSSERDQNRPAARYG